MQAGFVIFTIDVTNPEDYNEYKISLGIAIRLSLI